MTITDIPRGGKRARCFRKSETTVLFIIAEVSDEGQYFETCYDILTEPQVEQAIEALQGGLRGLRGLRGEPPLRRHYPG